MRVVDGGPIRASSFGQTLCTCGATNADIDAAVDLLGLIYSGTMIRHPQDFDNAERGRVSAFNQVLDEFEETWNRAGRLTGIWGHGQLFVLDAREMLERTWIEAHGCPEAAARFPAALRTYRIAVIEAIHDAAGSEAA